MDSQTHVPRSARFLSLRGECECRKKERWNAFALVIPMFPSFPHSEAPRAGAREAVR